MTIEDTRAQKALLRREYMLKRQQLTTEQKADYDRRLADSFILLPEFQQADMLLCTLSTREETDTYPIIEAARITGKQVAVPRCMPGRHLRFYYYESNTTLEYSRFGILEPILSSRIVSDFSKSVCLVPALCCDGDGYRLGYGGGYFDRFLSGYTGPTVSLIYPGHISDEPLPRENTDIPVDKVLTL